MKVLCKSVLAAISIFGNVEKLDWPTHKKLHYNSTCDENSYKNALQYYEYKDRPEILYSIIWGNIMIVQPKVLLSISTIFFPFFSKHCIFFLSLWQNFINLCFISPYLCSIGVNTGC